MVHLNKFRPKTRIELYVKRNIQNEFFFLLFFSKQPLRQDSLPHIHTQKKKLARYIWRKDKLRNATLSLGTNFGHDRGPPTSPVIASTHLNLFPFASVPSLSASWVSRQQTPFRPSAVSSWKGPPPENRGKITLATLRSVKMEHQFPSALSGAPSIGITSRYGSARQPSVVTAGRGGQPPPHEILETLAVILVQPPPQKIGSSYATDRTCFIRRSGDRLRTSHN